MPGGMVEPYVSIGYGSNPDPRVCPKHAHECPDWCTWGELQGEARAER